MSRAVEPFEVAVRVDEWIQQNAPGLDEEDAIFRLHQLAAEVYATGWDDGSAVQSMKESRRRGREVPR